MLELAGARPLAYVGDIEFECRDLVATTGNARGLLDEVVHGQGPQLACRRPSGATSGNQFARGRTVAVSDALWVSRGETQLRGMLLGMNVGDHGRKSA